MGSYASMKVLPPFPPARTRTLSPGLRPDTEWGSKGSQQRPKAPQALQDSCWATSLSRRWRAHLPPRSLPAHVPRAAPLLSSSPATRMGGGPEGHCPKPMAPRGRPARWWQGARGQGEDPRPRSASRPCPRIAERNPWAGCWLFVGTRHKGFEKVKWGVPGGSGRGQLGPEDGVSVSKRELKCFY